MVYKPVFTPFSTVGFFDGSSKEGRCGCGMVNDRHCFNLWMRGEVGSNTKPELLGLFFANKCGIDTLNIYGDSKIIIEWAKGNYNLQVIHLKSWCRRTTLLINFFNQISFMHISRIFNREADRLSKLAVNCNFGTLYFQEVQEDKISMEGSVTLN